MIIRLSWLFRTLTFLSTLFFVGQVFAAPSPDYFPLGGLVLMNGAPLANVRIDAGTLGTRYSDAGGSFSFGSQQQGTVFTYTASLPGYQFTPDSYMGSVFGPTAIIFTASTNLPTDHSVRGKITQNGSGLAGVYVVLKYNGGSSKSTSTNYDGSYFFTNITYGTQYSVTPSMDGYSFDPISRSGTLTSDVTNADFSASVYQIPNYTISGSVTKNGVGLAGVTINGGGLGNRTTDLQGGFTYTEIPQGTQYSLTPSLSGTNFTPLQANGTVNQDVNVTFSGASVQVQSYFTLSGTVNQNGGPLAGVTINGGALGNRTTGSKGEFSFTDVLSGTQYVLRPSLGGWTFIPEQASGALTQNVTVSFSGIPDQVQNYTLSGTVIKSGTPVSGAIINGGALGNRTTGSKGEFSFLNVSKGTPFTLTPSSSGMTFAPLQAYGTVNQNLSVTFSGSSVQNYYTLSGIVAKNGTPLAGVTINGGALGSRTSGSKGEFSFVDLTQGKPYTLTPSLSGTTFTPAQISGTMSQNISVTFSGSSTELPHYSLSGTVTKNGAALAGVTINGGALGNRTTSSQGEFSFTNLPSGTQYVLRPSLDGTTFTPEQASGTITQNISVNFSTAACVGSACPNSRYSASGRVTYKGQAFAAASVFVGPTKTTTVTDGSFSASGLVAGSYTAHPSASGMRFTPTLRSVRIQNQNITGLDFVGTCVNIYKIVLNGKCDFPSLTVSGRVLLSGSPVEGASVKFGTRVTKTDSSGNYSLSGIQAGTYRPTAKFQGYRFASLPVMKITANATANFTATCSSGYSNVDGKCTRSAHTETN